MKILSTQNSTHGGYSTTRRTKFYYSISANSWKKCFIITVQLVLDWFLILVHIIAELVCTVINISPAHCDRKPCISVWTGQDRKAKFDDGHVWPDQIKSKNSTNASEEKEKNLWEVPSFRKLDVIKSSELVDHEEKIV